jgi:hypothetical protein
MLSSRTSPCPFSFVDQALYRLFYLADRLVHASLPLETVITHQGAGCFLCAAFDLVSCSTHQMVFLHLVIVASGRIRALMHWSGSCLLILAAKDQAPSIDERVSFRGIAYQHLLANWLTRFFGIYRKYTPCPNPPPITK